MYRNLIIKNRKDTSIIKYSDDFFNNIITIDRKLQSNREEETHSKNVTHHLCYHKINQKTYQQRDENIIIFILNK